MRRYAKATALYSVAHFAVDFSCAFFIFSKLQDVGQLAMYLLIYNFFAFAMQMPMGLVADTTGKNHIFAAFGCFAVAISAFFGSSPLVLCVLAGMGNGLFHIGAGRDILCNCGDRFSELGIFVSPGAVGLYIGTMAGKTLAASTLFPIFLLVVTGAFILWLIPAQRCTCRNDSPSFSLQHISGIAILMLICLFIVVCLRSYVGMTLTFPWKTESFWALSLVFALALGKASGGILADRVGAIPVTLISLLASALLFFLYKTPFCGVLSVFFFNMSMPITLGAVTRLLPHAKGFGFGLLTFGLFIGILPVVLGLPFSLRLPWGFAAASLVSCLLLCFGLKKTRQVAKHGN